MRYEVFKMVCIVAGSFICMTAMLAIVGYIVESTYLVSWGGSTQMALPTATLFFTIGLVFIMFGIDGKKNDHP